MFFIIAGVRGVVVSRLRRMQFPAGSFSEEPGRTFILFFLSKDANYFVVRLRPRLPVGEREAMAPGPQFTKKTQGTPRCDPGTCLPGVRPSTAELHTQTPFRA